MEPWLQVLITAVVTVLASSGFWAFITKKSDKNDAEARMLVGLGHDRIIELGLKYIQRGWITEEEYENLNDYLYKPYEELGGNGSAKRVMLEVNRLPIRQLCFSKED
jgi:hypothetical protein